MHVLRVLLDCPFAGLHTGETHFMQEILLCSCICCASKLAIGERCLYRLKGAFAVSGIYHWLPSTPFR